MTSIRYVRSAATVSWIDPATGLPEVDHFPPGATATRAYLTGSSGFRFVNFMEVWANYNLEQNTIVGHGFTNASHIYTSPSFGGIASERFVPIQTVRVGREPIVFRQIVGARTRSPEVIGSWFGGPAGNIIANLITGFPPIWSEIEIQLFNDGRVVTSVVRHSLFPSLTYFTRPVVMSGVADESGDYVRSNVNGNVCYDGIPNLARWNQRGDGWGPAQGGPGATRGNPWDVYDSLFNGIDPTQPFGWL